MSKIPKKLSYEFDEQGGMDSFSPAFRIEDAETKTLQFIIDTADHGHYRYVWPKDLTILNEETENEKNITTIEQENAAAINYVKKLVVELITRYNNFKETP